MDIEPQVLQLGPSPRAAAAPDAGCAGAGYPLRTHPPCQEKV